MFLLSSEPTESETKVETNSNNPLSRAGDSPVS